VSEIPHLEQMHSHSLAIAEFAFVGVGVSLRGLRACRMLPAVEKKRVWERRDVRLYGYDMKAINITVLVEV
jgi:hypothetical protein